MGTFSIEGGHKLKGSIYPQGAKNEALQVICAALLTKDEVIINNIPEIIDVINLIDLLSSLGVKVSRISKNKYSFKSDNINLDFLLSKSFKEKKIHQESFTVIKKQIKNRFPKLKVELNLMSLDSKITKF